jgi:hypothetical protein
MLKNQKPPQQETTMNSLSEMALTPSAHSAGFDSSDHADPPTGAMTAADTAEYVADMTAQMAVMARAAGLAQLAHHLTVTAFVARNLSGGEAQLHA